MHFTGTPAFARRCYMLDVVDPRWRHIGRNAVAELERFVAPDHDGATSDGGAVVDDLLGAPPGTGKLLDELASVGDDLGCVTFNGTPPFTAVMDTELPVLGDVDPDAARRGIERLEVARAGLAATDPGSPWGRQARALAAMCMAATAGLKCLLGEMLTAAGHDAVIGAQRTGWLRTSRPGGLEDLAGQAAQSVMIQGVDHRGRSTGRGGVRWRS